MADDLQFVRKVQKNEITEHIVYHKLANMTKEKNNKKILEHISNDELRHYNFWKTVSKEEIKPNHLKAWFYVFISRILGLSFGLKLMENGEVLAGEAYSNAIKKYAKAESIMKDEHKHESQLLTMFEEEKLDYAGSIVLGLNDALVELTGALAGFTFALQNGRLIGIIGLITGIAASMSMAASGYLQSKEEDNDEKNPIKSAIYTGIAYIVTVILLVIPFFLINNVFVSLAVTLGIAILVILGYTFYITTAKGLRFWRRFLEMAIISLTVAIISFGIGWAVKSFLGLDV